MRRGAVHQGLPSRTRRIGIDARAIFVGDLEPIVAVIAVLVNQQSGRDNNLSHKRLRPDVPGYAVRDCRSKEGASAVSAIFAITGNGASWDGDVETP
jgi:hypothetical protein